MTDVQNLRRCGSIFKRLENHFALYRTALRVNKNKLEISDCNLRHRIIYVGIRGWFPPVYGGIPPQITRIPAIVRFGFLVPSSNRVFPEFTKGDTE